MAKQTKPLPTLDRTVNGTNYYGLTVPPADLLIVKTEADRNNEAAVKWSGSTPPPARGTRVNIQMNNLGPGIVLGYFIEHGWLGVHVQLTKPPLWFRRQEKEARRRFYPGQALVFGVELEPFD